MKNIFVVLSLFILSLASLSGCANHTDNITYTETVSETSSDLFVVSETLSVEKENIIYVSIQGEITNPGVYIINSGSRVYELINKAGGVTDNADTSSINMVFVLEDGMQLVIPKKQSEEAYVVSEELSTADTDKSTQDSGLVNINTASLEELTTLTGIGTTRAKAIIAYRDNGGVFEKPEDLMKVSGIKSGLYEGLKEQICVK